ncbi:MAG: type II toxin-antitoxin system PemK/MazF family toxin [Candidatus Poribacteria bacterium]
MLQPSRGEIWLINLDPTKGHEQSGIRPSLIISTDHFNLGPAELIVVAPVTTAQKSIPLHVEINPPEGGLKKRSFIKCDSIRSVTKERLIERWGVVSDITMLKVEKCLRILLEL